MSDVGSILEVKDLCIYFPITRGVLKRRVGEIKAVDEISFSIRKQETVALEACASIGLTRCLNDLDMIGVGGEVFKTGAVSTCGQ